MNRKNNLINTLILLLVCMTGFCLPFIASAGEMTITFRSPESQTDKRYDYDNTLLELALEKTKKEYGDYRLMPSGVMNYARAIYSINENKLVNFFQKLSYEDRFVDKMDMDYVPFPVDLGIVGYRVCFACPEIKEKLQHVNHIEDLKKFTHGQGRGWADVRILRHHGFNVHEVNTYESLFSMVAINRFDLFCRGTNELFDEYEAHKQIKNFTYDTSLSIAYPLPRFFWSHKSNKKALERITKGLITAYNDGSLKELWMKNYQKSIEFVRLDKRKIYHIENPLIKKLDFDYKKYFYDPSRKVSGK